MSDFLLLLIARNKRCICGPQWSRSAGWCLAED